MFNIGDTIVYSVHGLSIIDDICEKTVSNVTRKYYVLHPIDQSNLSISTPVDNDKVVMLKMMTPGEAKQVLQSFKEPGIEWIEDPRQRSANYQGVLKNGKREDIAKVANTMMRKSLELRLIEKKLYDQDRKILETIQNILFIEIAVSLNSTFDDISEEVDKLIKG